MSVKSRMVHGVVWIALDNPRSVGNVVLNSIRPILSTVLPVGKRPIILLTGFGQQACVSIWGMVVIHVLMQKRALETVRLLRHGYATSNSMPNHQGSNLKVIPLSQLFILMASTVCQSHFVDVLGRRTWCWTTIWTLDCSLLHTSRFTRHLPLLFWTTTCWPIWSAIPPRTNITRSCVV